MFCKTVPFGTDKTEKLKKKNDFAKVQRKDDKTSPLHEWKKQPFWIWYCVLYFIPKEIEKKMWN